MTEHFKRQEERASKRAGGEEDYDEGKHFHISKECTCHAANVLFRSEAVGYRIHT
jgi:hypothetical protein